MSSDTFVLRLLMSGGGWDGPALMTAVADAANRPANLTSERFSIRAATLLPDVVHSTAHARLSGLLIVLELAGARSGWQGRDLRIIGADRLAEIDRTTLLNLRAEGRIVDADNGTLGSLRAAHANWKVANHVP